MIDVVAAVIERDGKVLLGQRPAGKRHGSMWEFPGGKVHEDESFRDALGRELKEELELELTHAGEVLFSVQDPGSEFLIHFVRCEAEGEPSAVEHEAVRWMHRAETVETELAPADRSFVERWRELERL